MSSQNKYESDPSFLARWIANELSEEELATFKKSEAYSDFKRINEVAQEFKAPEVDTNSALRKIKVKMKSATTKKVIKIKPFWYATAASVAILLGIFTVLNITKTYTTPYGKQLAINLPDGSKVQLNAGSTITHKRFFWTKNRALELNGEAYFEVEKGNSFSVNTPYGEVSVLGTKFNVKSRSQIFEVNCFEGAVRFDKKDSEQYKILYQNDRIILTKSEAIKEEKIQETTPNWMRDISIFKERPLQEVIEELSIQYDIRFESKNIDLSRTFTGSFVHNNLEVALKTTLTPMEINYTISENQTIIYLH